MVKNGYRYSEKFRKRWRGLFKEILCEEVANQIGYKHLAGGYLRTIGISLLQKKNHEFEIVNRFRKGLVSLCGKYEVDLKQKFSLNDYDYIGERRTILRPSTQLPVETVMILRKLYLQLKNEMEIVKRDYQNVHNYQKHPRKPRIKKNVAIALIQLLHFHRGHRDGLDEIAKWFVTNGDLQQELQEIEKTTKNAILESLKEDINEIENKRKMSHSKNTRDKYNLKIEEIKTEIKRVNGAKVVLSIFGNRDRGNDDTRWANHWKEHLTRSYLAEGRARLPKSLSSELQRRKKVFLKDIERRNRELTK